MEESRREAKLREIEEHVVSIIGDKLIKEFPGLAWRQGWKIRIRDSYNTNRTKTHSKMCEFPHTPDHRIDRHKVAAAYTTAIIKTKPLEVIATTPYPSAGARLANESLAFLSAVKIVRDFLIARFKGAEEFQGGEEWPDKIATNAITFPLANDGEYPEHMYKALFHAHGELNEFILANLYFLIESYHLKSLGWNGALPKPTEDNIILEGL